jgi:hypothetical protein
MYHPPYSPDLALCDFSLFQKLKSTHPEGQRFAVIQFNVTLLQGIVENDFQDCFFQWHHHLTKGIASQGEYLDVDSSASAQVSHSWI